MKIICFTWLALCLAVAHAQIPTDKMTPETVAGAQKNANVLTLADALVLAEKKNLNLLAMQEERKIADGRYIEYRSHALPRLNLQAQYLHVDDVITIEMGDGAFQMGQLENYKAVAEMTQPIYSGGALGAALKIGKEGQAIADRQTDYARTELAYQVHRLFNGILLEKEHVSVAQDAITAAKQNLHDVNARHKQGVVRKFDLLRAKEQVSSRNADSIAAENGLHKSRLRLFHVLDLPLDDKRSISGTLKYEPVEFITSNAVAQAIANRDDVIAANHVVELQQSAVDLAKSTSRPQIGLFCETKYANPDRSFNDEWEASWMVGIQAKIPVFNGYLTKGKVLQEKAKLRQAELRLKSLLSLVSLDVTLAIVDIETADKLVKARRGNVTEAREALRLARRGYEEGLLQQVDVLNAQLSLTDGQQKHAQAIFQHIMAKRQLQRVTGMLTQDSTIKKRQFSRNT